MFSLRKTKLLAVSVLCFVESSSTPLKLQVLNLKLLYNMFWPVKLFGIMQETTVCYLSFVLVPGSMYGRLSIEQKHFRQFLDLYCFKPGILLNSMKKFKLQLITIDATKLGDCLNNICKWKGTAKICRYNVLVCFAESLSSHWLQKGYSLVEQAFEEYKQNLLEKEPLVYLSLALAKSGMTVPASTILRKLVETEEYPHVSAWSAVLAHMSLAGSGSYLSAELVLEIGYLFQSNRVDPRKKSNAPLLAMKPYTQAMNIALAGCLLFGTTRKAEELLDMRPKIGVKADANLLVIMAHIYERNGRREELRKLQRHIDEACNLNDSQFW